MLENVHGWQMSGMENVQYRSWEETRKPIEQQRESLNPRRIYCRLIATTSKLEVIKGLIYFSWPKERRILICTRSLSKIHRVFKAKSFVEI